MSGSRAAGVAGTQQTTPAIVLRDATTEDLPAVAAIYAHHVLNGVASFEDEPPDLAEMRRRFEDVRGRALPFLVAAGDAGELAGFAYAALYRQRSAYRYTLEDSIYVAHDRLRRGIGRALLQDLIARATASGYRQMVAVIGDSANRASIALHERAGFRRVGVLPATGFKFRQWVDVVLMQRELGEGASTRP